MNDTFSFTISGVDRDYFYINNNKLYVNKVFNYTDGTKKNISISIEDSFGLTYSQEVEIDIINVPPEINLDSTSVSENKVSGFVVGELSSNEEVVFSLVSGDGDTNNNDFIIDGSTLKQILPLIMKNQI